MGRPVAEWTLSTLDPAMLCRQVDNPRVQRIELIDWTESRPSHNTGSANRSLI